MHFPGPSGLTVEEGRSRSLKSHRNVFICLVPLGDGNFWDDVYKFLKITLAFKQPEEKQKSLQSY